MKEIADTLPPKPNEERPGFWIPNEVDVVRFLEDYLKHRILQINYVDVVSSCINHRI